MDQELVIVYGTLRQGYGNHRLIEQSGLGYVGTDKVDGFEMFPVGHGAFPFVREAGQGNKVVVEVYCAHSPRHLAAAMQRLDRLEGYPHMYNRKLVQTETGLIGWIYFDSDFHFGTNGKKVESGDWNDFDRRAM